MPDTVRHVMWYTVYDAKTGDLIANGTSEMCARRLGYKSANSFASASSHGRSGRHPARKYIFEKERIRRDEVDSLPPIRRKKEEPARAPTRTSQKGDEFAAHHHKNNTKQEVLQVALLRIYDVDQEPPALVSQQQFPVVSDAVAIADELAKRKPERLYRVFDADMNVVYAR